MQFNDILHMRKLGRIKEFRAIKKDAGIVTDLVRKTLSIEPEAKSQLDSVKYNPQMLVINANAGAYFPENPVSTNGVVNIMFQFRWVKSARPTGSGINTVVVFADAAGLGGGSGAKALGDPSFINSTVAKILNHLRKDYPNVKLGKLGLSAFSGGYGPVWWALENKSKLVKEPDAIIISDGIHHSTKPGSAGMKPWVEYAQSAAQDPSKRFIILHSGVQPQGYSSTTQTADYILGGIGAARDSATSGYWQSWNIQPTSEAQKGGVTILQIAGKDGNAHMSAGKALPHMWNTYLQDWNY